LAKALVVAALNFLLAAPIARADGDPASDYLLSQSSFVPPDAGVPSVYEAQLNGVLRDAKARGYEIRVAVIATRNDLGSVGVLYEQPERYARFLGQELNFVYKGRLLVVMPNGYGVSRGGRPVPADQAIVDRLSPPGSLGSGPAIGATRAVVRLAAAAGVIVPVPPLSGSKRAPGSGNHRLVIAIVVAAVLVALAGAIVIGRRLLREPPPAT
jgi:hypothetical protein